MTSLGCRAGAAVTLFVLGATVLAVPAGAGATGQSTAPSPPCVTELIGITSTKQVRVVSVRDGVVSRIRTSADALPYDPVGLLPRNITAKAGVTTISSVAIHPQGIPRVIRASYAGHGQTLSWTSRTWNQAPFFKPGLVAEGHDSIFAVSSSGTLQLWNADAGHVRGIGKGYGNLTTLQYAGSFVAADRKLRDVLYATTESGGLEQILVPRSNLTADKVRVLATSGYAGVSELAVGNCYGNPNRDVLVAVNSSGSSATWTTVVNAVSARPATTVQRGPVGSSAGWQLHSVASLGID